MVIGIMKNVDCLYAKLAVRITNQKCKTSAQMLESCDVGDILFMKVPIFYNGVGGYKGTYATYIEIENQRTKENTRLSMNQITLLFRAFDVEECDKGEPYTFL